MMGYRVGSGFDQHRLKTGRPCMLGCVEVAWTAGPQGHSDGDPLAHALADALLGAAGLGDLGEHFPDGDPAWEGAPGAAILGKTAELVRMAGFGVVNIDLTVFLERPRLQESRGAIRQRLGQVLGIDPGRIGLKATTAEGFGAVGRGECVAAQATVLLEEMGPEESER